MTKGKKLKQQALLKLKNTVIFQPDSFQFHLIWPKLNRTHLYRSNVAIYEIFMKVMWEAYLKDYLQSEMRNHVKFMLSKKAIKLSLGLTFNVKLDSDH